MTDTAKESSLRRMMLERSRDKYRLVAVAMRWAHEVRQREDAPPTPQEILNVALEEVLAGKVSLEDVEKLPPIPKVVAKPAPALPSLDKLAPDEEKAAAAAVESAAE